MHIVFFLLLASSLFAQENYVIDSVCVGTERTYRRDGEAGYTYYWEIVDSLRRDTFAPAGSDFVEIVGTDTTLGNQIDWLWDREGAYGVTVLVTTEHGCDTVEQGLVKVFELPEVDAGPDSTLCLSIPEVTLINDSAWHYSILYWASLGDGTFRYDDRLHPTYIFGAGDMAARQASLVMRAEGLAQNNTCEPAYDTVTFTLTMPELTASLQDPLCYRDSSGNIRVNVLNGYPPYNFEWEGPPGFVSQNTDSIGNLPAGSYIVKVSDYYSCVVADTFELIDPPQLIISIDDVIDVSCYGYSDGSILASASGGTGALSFRWEKEGLFWASEDSIYNLSGGIYVLTVSDENDCVARDSVEVVEPPLLQAQVVAVDSTLCEGELLVLSGTRIGGTGAVMHSWSGSGAASLDFTDRENVIFTAPDSGSYELVYTITDAAGCQASDTFHLYVYPPTFSVDSMEICAGSSDFVWNHRTITADMDRTYLDTLVGMNQFGCDSFLTLNVKVLFPATYDTTLYVCEDEAPFSLFNKTIIPGADSIYLDTLYYAASGCDSLHITMNVFNNPVSDTLLAMTFCAGAPPFQLNNRWIETDASRIYLDTLPGANAYGCDSLLTYDVTILPPDTFYVYDTVCQNSPPYVWVETSTDTIVVQTLFDSTYTARLKNMAGCDSLVHLGVHVIPPTDTVIDTMLCYDPGYSFAWNHREVFAIHDSTYLDTLVNAAGCDSLLTLNVSIRYPDWVNIDTVLCEGEPMFAWGTNTVYSVDTYIDSVYSDTLQNRLGCDSIVNLSVRILHPVELRDTISLCANQPAFDWYGLNILTDRDSIYLDTLYYPQGCDSLRLNLTFISLPLADTLIDTLLCEGSPEFYWNNVWIQTDSSRTYRDILLGANQYGCDSMLTYNVTILPVVKDTTYNVLCYGEPVADWYGIPISSERDSIYKYFQTGAGGCDTLRFLNVKVNPLTDTTLMRTLCYGYPEFKWNNRLISGVRDSIYLDTLPAANQYGCDSLLTYVITVLPPDTTLVYDTLCMGQPEYVWNGFIVSSAVSDVYEARLSTSAGCDSIVRLETTVIEGIVTHDTVYACSEYTWTEGTGLSYTASGVYTYPITPGAACSDSVKLHLFLGQPPVLQLDAIPVLCYNGKEGAIDLTVTGGTPPYSYEWSNGQRTEDILNLVAGTYSVTVSDSMGCAVSDSIEITQPPLLEITDVRIQTVPGNSGHANFYVEVQGGTEPYSFLWSTGEKTQQLNNMGPGSYSVEVTDANGCFALYAFQYDYNVTATCPDTLKLVCFEELAANPPFASYQEFEEAGGKMISSCGIDTSSFAVTVSVDNIGSVCYTELRAYTVSDSCGQVVGPCYQVVMVNDTEQPLLSCPPNLIVSNGIVPTAYADTTEFIAAGGSMSDNCGIVNFGLLSENSDGGVNPEIITRTYQVSDYCGNTEICTQEVKVYQATDVAIGCGGLPDTYYACRDFRPEYASLEDFVAAGGQYSSSFAIDTFYYRDEEQGTYCPTINRTYALVNVVGDTAFCVQSFEVLDTVAPRLILPDKYLSCTDPFWPVYTSYNDVLKYRVSHGNDVIENCGFASIRAVSLQSREMTPGCPSVELRTYSIVDYCGNRSTAQERIYINDDAPPVIAGLPSEIASDCNIPEPISDPYLYASDNCGPIELTYRDSVEGDGSGGVIYRIYTFSDMCNSVEFRQKIVGAMTVDPQFEVVSPICQSEEIITLPDTSLNGITGTWSPSTVENDVPGDFDYTFIPDPDQCATPAHLHVVVLPAISLTETHVDQGYNPNPTGSISLNIDGGSGNYAISWTGPNGFSSNSEDLNALEAGTYHVEVRDEIGCFDSLSVSIQKQVPELTCPPDLSVECINVDAFPAAQTLNEFIAAGGTYTPISLASEFFSTEDTLEDEYCLTLRRTYTVKDVYGREASCEQLIHFYDYVPPVLVAPEDRNVDCVADVAPSIESFEDFLALGGTAMDPNCELDTASYSVVRRDPVVLSTGVRITYVFSIRDLCGNEAKDSVTYISSDFEAPVVQCNDITVVLDEYGNYVLSQTDLDTLIAGTTDNCTQWEDFLVNVSQEEFNCADLEGLQTIQVSVTDEAGNEGRCTAHVRVLDTIPPTALCQDLTVMLDESGQARITAAMVNNGTVDNCGIDSMAVSKELFDCTDVGPNPVQLVVRDIYGNTDTCTAMVTVVDEIAPYISCIVGDTITLSEEDGTYALTWQMVTDSVWDECGIDTVLLDKDLLTCDDIGFTTITATAYDVHGNSSECSANFIVFGNRPPNVQNDTAITAVNVPVDIDLVANDYDLKTSINLNTLGVLVQPGHGSVVIDKNTGIATYTPALDFTGQDWFRYEICDDAIPCTEECGTALVLVTVRAMNQPPVALNDSFEVPCGNLTGNVILNDSDPDNDPITVDPVLLTRPVNGIVIMNENGMFAYEPYVDFNEGLDSFQYVLVDNSQVPITPLKDTAWVYITRVADHDCDGIADRDDIDDDNDGIRDVEEGDGLVDSDMDGIPDSWDIDSDNDGIADNVEGQEENNYIEPDGWRDDNNNGWDDRYDSEEGGYAFVPVDTDGDGIPDFRDTDSDNDGVFDFIEAYDEDANGIADILPYYSDIDGDGLDDAYDFINGWGIPDLIDNETGSFAPLQDFDGDGTRDWRDTNDEDDQYMTRVEDLNGDGDYSNDDLDLDGHPEYLDVDLDCELFIPEGFSPNNDGVHDFFQILCIYPRYPDAKLMIFNRAGNKLFEKEHYGNYDYWGWEDAWWWGNSENMLTIGRAGGLPAGNYIYVLELNDGSGEVRSGTVMIAY